MKVGAVGFPALAVVLASMLGGCVVETCEERNAGAFEVIEREIRSAAVPLSLDEYRSSCGDSAQLPVAHYERDGATWDEVGASLQEAGWTESSGEEGAWTLDVDGLRLVAGADRAGPSGRVGVIAYFLE